MTRDVSRLGGQVRLVCQFFNYLEINVLPPYIPSQAEKDDPLLYAQNVRKLFADALGVPMVDQVSLSLTVVST